MKIEHQKVFFASDFHIGHQNVIKFDGRPHRDLQEMHQSLIDNWNSVVDDESIVFYLGDFSFKDRGAAKWFRDQLKGKIYFIMGNHDRMRIVSRLGFDRVFGDDTALGGATIEIKDEDANRGYQTIVMCHYPILSWNKSHHGSWHVHGHCHQSLSKNPEMDWYYKRKVIDAGVNGLGYTPISYTELKKIMNDKIVSSVDHHE